MTKLAKIVERKTDRFTIALLPGSMPLILIKEKRSRKWYELPFDAAWSLAVKMEVNRERARKAADKAVKREIKG